MKTETLVAKDWDDLVFENRNKEYGAYEVRKAYSGNLVAGFSVSMGIALLAFIIPIVFSLMGGDAKKIVEVIPKLSDPTVFSQPPVLEPPVTPPPAAAQAQVQTTALTPQVTTADVPETDIVSNDEMVFGNTTEPVEGPVGEGIASEGTGVVQVEVPAVVTPPTIFDRAEVMPSFEGGLEALYKFIKKKIHYPAASRRMGVDGTVFVSFVINSEGKVVDIKTIKGISADCDKEAERVIGLLPSWSPGMQNHRAVSVRMTLPIKFQLDK